MSLPLLERLKPILVVKELHYNLQVAWGAYQISKSFSKPSNIDGGLVIFAQDMVEMMIPNMVKVHLGCC